MSSRSQTWPEPALAERHEALLRVAKAISAHRDPKELIGFLESELRREFGFDYVGVFLYDELIKQMNWTVHRPEGTPARWVCQNQQPLVIPYLERETRFPGLAGQNIQSVCVLPLTTAHRRLGSIGIGSTSPAAYSEDEVRFLSLAADQVARAIDDAVNFEFSKRSEERLKLLLDLTNSLVSNLQLRDLLRAIASNVRRVMRCDGVGVALPDVENNRLRIYALDFPEGKIIREELHSPDSAPSTAQTVFETGNALNLNGIDVAPRNPEAFADGIRSLCHLPLVSHDRILGVFSLARRENHRFTEEDIDFLMQVAKQVAIAVENALAYGQIAELKNQLAREKVYLQDEIRSELNFDEIVGRSARLRRVLQEVETVAPTDSTVLILGETGTGKELIARAIHDLSSRRASAFVKLNCAAIPSGLLESELFGHEKGAFTGAIHQRIGRFEVAHQGTVFLDEIAEIPLDLQPKLLRVLQEREFERLGSSHTQRTDARLIAATNQDLSALVEAQKFRMDLFYRLNVFPLHVPPLRERTEDIPLLVRHFVQQYARRMNKAIDTIPTETMDTLVRYDWPGNIRELQNLMERAVILSSGPVLKVPLADLKSRPAPHRAMKLQSMEDAERRHILDALGTSNWIVAGPNGAAALLGMKRSTLKSRMEKLGIRRARAADAS